jgi:phage-related minor tail protein
MLEMSRITGGDATANSELFSRVVGDWSIPIQKAASSMDSLFAAAQQTGAPLDQLMDSIVQYGAPMRNFGFSFEEAGAILASFEAQGVNTEIVMSGLRMAQGKFIKQGKDMNTGLWETVDAIKNAESGTEALSIATKIFGAKAAGDMVDTIRSGKFELDGLVDTMKNADGIIMETAQGTADWAEKWQIFKNKVTLALEPLGSKMIVSLGGVMDTLAQIFERPEVQAGLTNLTMMLGNFISQAVTYIPVLIDGFMQLITFLQNNQGIVIGIFAALGVAVTAWAVVTAAAAWTAMAPFLPVIAVILLIAAAVYLLYQAWTTNFGGIQEKVTTFWAQLQPVFATLREWLSTNLPVAINYLKGIWDTWLQGLQMAWSFLQTYIFPILGALAELFGAVLGYAIRFVGQYIVTYFWEPFQMAFGWIKDNVFPILEKFYDWLAVKLAPVFTKVANAVSGLVGWIKNLAASISNLSLPAWLTPGSPTPWELGLLGVGDAMRQLARTEMPAFTSALELQASPMGVGGGSSTALRSAQSGNGGGGLVVNINVTSDGVTDERDVARRIASAVDVLLRERGLA